jgi:hypothetical protein
MSSTPKTTSIPTRSPPQHSDPSPLDRNTPFSENNVIPFTNAHFHTHASTQTRPLAFFNLTRAELHPTPSIGGSAQDSARWSSRASRKNRYALSTVHLSHHPSTGPGVDSEKGVKGDGVATGGDKVLVTQRLRHPRQQMKVHLSWNISFWVAVIFVLGSIAWVRHGHRLPIPDL